MVPSPPPHAAITVRAVALSLLLIPVNAFTLLHTGVVRHQAYPTSYALFGNVIALLAVLLLVNAIVRRWLPRSAFSPGELLTCYLLLCAASAVSNDQTIFLLVGMLGHPAWFGNAVNRWQERFGEGLPGWLVVRDRAVLEGFYQGRSTVWNAATLAAWLPPLLAWTGFLLVLIAVMLCLNALVRRPWTEAQRLSFPLIQLPLQMLAPRAGLFQSRLLWGGFALTALVNAVNGLHELYPVLPEIPRHLDLALYWPRERPWNAFPAWPGARIPMGIYPFIFGLGLLMPLDLVFSCWFFYVCIRLAAVAQAARGWESLPRFPFDVDLASGAFAGLFVYSTWQLRAHLRIIYDRILGRGVADEGDEPMGYRMAAIGAVGGLALLTLFLWRAGMSPGLALTFFLVYFAFSLVLTRLRAEAGIASHDLYLGGPDVLLTSTFGTQALSRSDLAGISLLFWFNRAYDAHPMPQQAEGYRLASRIGLSLRGATGLMLLGALAGAVSGFLIMLHVMYQLGAASGKVVECITISGEPWRRLASWLSAPSAADGQAMAARGIGLGLCALWLTLRNAGLWCPFHPVGLAIAGTWAMYKIWSTLMFSWMAKALALRYGGRRLYEGLVQVGLGMVLGDCALGGFWAVFGAFNNVATFGVWP